jgi:hypothetical protein
MSAVTLNGSLDADAVAAVARGAGIELDERCTRRHLRSRSQASIGAAALGEPRAAGFSRPTRPVKGRLRRVRCWLG